MIKLPLSTEFKETDEPVAAVAVEADVPYSCEGCEFFRVPTYESHDVTVALISRDPAPLWLVRPRH